MYNYSESLTNAPLRILEILIFSSAKVYTSILIDITKQNEPADERK
jgi:hypothetical protein